MTLTQLEAFVLVARLGSVKGAARTLTVTEPAVSSALASLRHHLGDPLVQRTPTGMALTPGGRRLVGIASQIVGLAREAEAAIREVQGAPEQLRAVATSDVAESVGPALVAAFTARSKAVDVSLGVCAASGMAALLRDRLADVALGPRLPGDGSPPLQSAPLFRYRLVFVAAPGHPLAAAGALEPRTLVDQQWHVGPDAADGASPVRAILDRLGITEGQIEVFPSLAAALAATEHGHGIAATVAHLLSDDRGRQALVRLPVRGTPLDLMWHVTMLGADSRAGAASAFNRFVGTPAATQAMHAPLRGVPPSEFRPPVHVTIWS